MRRLLTGALLLAAGLANAQEGFPLDGTWRCELEAPGKSRVTIVIVMQWDGQQVTGMINPGPRSIPLQKATLDPEGWKVSLAAKDSAGRPIAFTGAIADLGSTRRSVNGTWTEGGQSYQVRFVLE